MSTNQPETGRIPEPTDDAKEGGEDDVEEAVGIVTETTHAAQFLRCHQSIWTCRVHLKWRRGRVEIPATVKLPSR